MRTRYIHIATVSFILFLSGCSETSPFFTKDQAQVLLDSAAAAHDPFKAVKNVVAVINNDIYYFDNLNTAPRQITNTPNESKKNVKLSFDKTQIAYLNSSGIPVVIAVSDGSVIKTLSNYAYPTQMDWAKDRQTLYLLIGQKVYFYGEALTVIQPEIVGYYDDVSSFSMNSIGDQGYYIQHEDFDFIHRLEFYSKSQGIDQDGLQIGENRYVYIDFYDNKGNYLVANRDDSNVGYDYIACVKDYIPTAAYEWDDERMNTPEFNGDNEVLLYGTLKDQVYQIKAVYLGTALYPAEGTYDIYTKVLDKYTSSSPIYLDWVH